MQGIEIMFGVVPNNDRAVNHIL